MKAKLPHEERRSSLSKRLRPAIEEEMVRLRMLYSTLHMAKVKHLPHKTINALNNACNILTEKVHKMGLPNSRIKEIKEQAEH